MINMNNITMNKGSVFVTETTWDKDYAFSFALHLGSAASVSVPVTRDDLLSIRALIAAALADADARLIEQKQAETATA